MAKLRGGIFGCGMISEFHLRAWQRIPEVEIAALGNRTLEKADARRAQFAPRARVYADLAAMLKAERLDFVDILTPPASHREHCLLALDAGAHVICQKPLCDTLEAARDLAARAERGPQLFAVHENHRYRPWFQDVLRRAREGFFGAIHEARFEQHDASEPPEAYKLRSERGILLEYGTHLVDMVRALLGEPRRVAATLARVNPRVKGESHARVVCEFPRATAVIDITWKPSGPFEGGVTISGDRGEARYEGTMTRGESSRFRLLQGSAVVKDEARRPTDDYIESFYAFQREYVDAMLSGRPVTQTAAENLKTLACAFAAYASAERGGSGMDM